MGFLHITGLEKRKGNCSGLQLFCGILEVQQAEKKKKLSAERLSLHTPLKA
jgi:hypothetical protein